MASTEWASWVQAVGSIVAIGAAAGIAIWQSRKQHKSSLELLRTEHRFARTEVARTLLVLSTNSLRLLKSYAAQLANSDAVHKAADGRIYFDLNELRVVEGAVHAIPLHTLPHDLVGLTMMVSSTLRQFRENIERALRLHHKMDAAQFNQFFSSISEMLQSLKKTCDEIQHEVAKAENEA